MSYGDPIKRNEPIYRLSSLSENEKLQIAQALGFRSPTKINDVMKVITPDNPVLRRMTYDEYKDGKRRFEYIPGQHYTSEVQAIRKELLQQAKQYELDRAAEKIGSIIERQALDQHKSSSLTR